MHDIDKILIDRGIMPTKLTAAEREFLNLRIAEVEGGKESGLTEFVHDLKKQLKQAAERLNDRLAEAMCLTEDMSKTVAAPLENGWLSFSSDASAYRRLTADHLSMLNSLTPLRIRIGDSLLAMAELSQRQFHGPLSAAVPVRILLSHIALCEGKGTQALSLAYKQLSDALPSLSEVLRELYSQGLDSIHQLCETVDNVATLTSDTVTAINKKQAPLTDYPKLLRALLIQIHNLAETLRQLQKEVRHVQIPDVL